MIQGKLQTSQSYSFRVNKDFTVGEFVYRYSVCLCVGVSVVVRRTLTCA